MLARSTACTDFPTDSAQTWRWVHRALTWGWLHRPVWQRRGWPSAAGTLPTPYASQCNKVLLMSRHSSPQGRLATFVNGITLPLRSAVITTASTLLRAAPPLALASVFFLMVSAICHFPLHPQQGSHVPYRSLC